MMQHPVELTFRSFIDSTFLHPMGFMWFLPALFVIFLIAFIFSKYLTFKHINRGGVFATIILSLIVLFSIGDSFQIKGISFMQISLALHFIPYFLMGMMYFRFKSIIDIKLKKYWMIIVPIFLAFSVSLQLGGFSAALCGIIFSVTLALLLESKCPESLVTASDYCYIVFLLSYFPQMFVRGPIAHNLPMINQYILSLLSFMSGLLIPLTCGLVFTALKRKSRIFDKYGILIGI